MVEIIDCQTFVDLVKLEMVNFDIIMGMDQLASCYANVEYQTKIVRFNFLGEIIREWKGNTATLKFRFISYLKSRRRITNGCFYILFTFMIQSRITGLSVYFGSYKLLDVFQEDLPGIPSEREINFAINLSLCTQPIYIPSYKITPTNLMVLKDPLKQFLDKGFIRPSV